MRNIIENFFLCMFLMERKPRGGAGLRISEVQKFAFSPLMKTLIGMD